MNRILIALLLIALTSGCYSMGQASDSEKAALATWSNAVTARDRAEVEREASLHTEWMEKKKVQWMIQQYRSRYNKQQVKKSATQPSPKVATRPGF